MKVSIIGGGGLVGSCTAFALQTGKIVRELALLHARSNALGIEVLHAHQEARARRAREEPRQKRGAEVADV